MKKQLADSERLQRYLQETYDEDAAEKKKKRIKGLPGLIFGRKNCRNRKRGSGSCR